MALRIINSGEKSGVLECRLLEKGLVVSGLCCLQLLLAASLGKSQRLLRSLFSLVNSCIALSLP